MPLQTPAVAQCYYLIPHLFKHQQWPSVTTWYRTSSNTSSGPVLLPDKRLFKHQQWPSVTTWYRVSSNTSSGPVLLPDTAPLQTSAVVLCYYLMQRLFKHRSGPVLLPDITAPLQAPAVVQCYYLIQRLFKHQQRPCEASDKDRLSPQQSHQHSCDWRA